MNWIHVLFFIYMYHNDGINIFKTNCIHIKLTLSVVLWINRSSAKKHIRSPFVWIWGVAADISVVLPWLSAETPSVHQHYCRPCGVVVRRHWMSGTGEVRISYNLPWQSNFPVSSEQRMSSGNCAISTVLVRYMINLVTNVNKQRVNKLRAINHYMYLI